MQFKTAILALVGVPAVMASLPSTLELFVFSADTIQQVGCVNGYGNFTRNLIWCLPYRSSVVADPWSSLSGYDACNIDDGTLNCQPGTTAAGLPRSNFTLSGADLERQLDGSTLWSYDELPAADDRYGVEIKVGTTGAFPVYLQVHSVQG